MKNAMTSILQMPLNPHIFSQSPYRCKLDFGQWGTAQALERNDIVVIVDTLSFSTTVVTAVSHGGLIYPCSITENSVMLAQRLGAEVAVRRNEVPHKGRFSLSPLTYLEMTAGTKIVIPSPNGGTCSSFAQTAPCLFIGSFVNAKAIANAISQILKATDLCVTIICCGERESALSDYGETRMAIEDYLGAGAIFSYLEYEKSPEAYVCEGAFLHVHKQLETILLDCGTGRKLCELGFAADIQHASQLNLYNSVPRMGVEGFLG
jgi:2-phosphosulfolactate phosphatase